jgi:hypothetical protein
MSREIRLSSELVDALNRYFDVWFKLYQTAEALESAGLYLILKYLGYWPVRAVIIVGRTRPRGLIEYETDSCKFHLWFSREPIPEEVIKDPRVQKETSEMMTPEEAGWPAHVHLSPDFLLEFYITEPYTVESKDFVLAVEFIVLTNRMFIVESDVKHGERITTKAFEFAIRGNALRYERGYDKYTKEEVPKELEDLGIYATRKFLQEKEKELLHSINCAINIFNKMLIPATTYILY